MGRVVFALVSILTAFVAVIVTPSANPPSTVAVAHQQFLDPPWPSRSTPTPTSTTSTVPPAPSQAAPSRPPVRMTARPAPPKPSTPVVTHRARQTVLSRAAAPVAMSNAAIWACIRRHESGGNYAIDTGNGYYGAYQFLLATWHAAGGVGYPDDASPATQDAIAQSWQRRAGWGQWSTAAACGGH